MFFFFRKKIIRKKETNPTFPPLFLFLKWLNYVILGVLKKCCLLFRDLLISAIAWDIYLNSFIFSEIAVFTYYCLLHEMSENQLYVLL